MQVTRCLHTAILVSDLSKADYFYGEVLGLTKVERGFNYPGSWYQLGDYQIHLIVHGNFSAILSNQEKWGRNPHLALGVTDINQAQESLAKAGYLCQSSASGRNALFTQDPDGNIIEISQID